MSTERNLPDERLPEDNHQSPVPYQAASERHHIWRVHTRDITISKPEDLDKNFRLGTLITIGVSEWFLTTNSYGHVWQNYSQGVVLDSEGMYLLILKTLEEDTPVELLHKGA